MKTSTATEVLLKVPDGVTIEIDENRVVTSTGKVLAVIKDNTVSIVKTVDRIIVKTS